MTTAMTVPHSTALSSLRRSFHSRLYLLLLAGTALGGLPAIPAEAATIDWQGSVSSDWADGNNWTGGVVPGAADVSQVGPYIAAPVVGVGVNSNVDVLIVGVSPTATSLTITGGGTLTSQFANVAVNATGTGGSVTITGSGSQLNATATLSVGALGTGTVDVLSGGTLSNDIAALGYQVGASGTVTVSGAGSLWSNTKNALVGFQGTGVASVTNGAAMTAAQDLSIGQAAGSTGAFTVSGAGSSAAMGNRISVGEYGTGTFNVLAGATVTSVYGEVGGHAGSTGTVTIDGAGSTWTLANGVSVGLAGTGTLNISNGGALSLVADLKVGSAATGVGSVVMSGSGSTLSIVPTADIGGAGYGEMMLSGGATASANNTRIGVLAGSQGGLQLSGIGTSWSTVNDLIVGNSGTGGVAVLYGSLLDTGGVATVGNAAGAVGSVLLGGVGSTWHVASVLYVGNSGSGTLTVNDDAHLQADTVLGIAVNGSSSGTVNIGAPIGAAATDAGNITATNGIVFGQGNGTLAFNHTESAYGFGTMLTSVNAAANIVVASGHTILTADNSGFTGTTTLTGGRLSVNNRLGGTINVLGGSLGGTGILGTVQLGSGGVLAPGNSIGTLNVANASFGAGSTYLVEVDNTGASDLLQATGVVTITSGASVSVRPVNGTDDGSTYCVNTLYTIVSATGGVSGTFGSVSDTFAFLRPELSYDPNNVFLTLTQDRLFSSAGLTPNQVATGTGADGLTAGHPMFNSLVMLATPNVPAALDALSGEGFATQAGTQLLDSRLVRNAILDRLQQSADAPAGSGGALGYVSAAPDQAALETGV